MAFSELAPLLKPPACSPTTAGLNWAIPSSVTLAAVEATFWLRFYYPKGALSEINHCWYGEVKMRCSRWRLCRNRRRHSRASCATYQGWEEPCVISFYKVIGSQRYRRLADHSKNVHGFQVQSELSLRRLEKGANICGLQVHDVRPRSCIGKLLLAVISWLQTALICTSCETEMDAFLLNTYPDSSSVQNSGGLI